MQDYLLFFNVCDKDGLRTTRPYMDYLLNHGVYDDSKFTCEEIVKTDELEFNFMDELEKIKKNEKLLIICTADKPNLTKLFHLEKDFIPNIEEIELMKSTWYQHLDSSMEKIIFNSKLFKENFNFNYNRSKTKLKENKLEDEIKYCAVQKASIMLNDFYFENDPLYREKVLSEKNNLNYNTKLIDEIAERLSENAVEDLQKLNSLTNYKNKIISEKIKKLLNQYCITHIDWLKKAQELTLLSAKENIDITLTRDELLKAGAMNSAGSTDLEKVYKLMQEKYEILIEQKNMELAKKEEQRVLEETMKNKDGKTEMTRIDEYGTNQINWTSFKPNYTNSFNYEKFTPYPLRGRKQFVCWRTEWKQSYKPLLDENKKIVYDEEGNIKLLPLYDANGNIVYDENGNVVYDGKWIENRHLLC